MRAETQAQAEQAEAAIRTTLAVILGGFMSKPCDTGVEVLGGRAAAWAKPHPEEVGFAVGHDGNTYRATWRLLEQVGRRHGLVEVAYVIRDDGLHAGSSKPKPLAADWPRAEAEAFCARLCGALFEFQPALRWSHGAKESQVAVVLDSREPRHMPDEALAAAVGTVLRCAGMKAGHRLRVDKVARAKPGWRA